MFIIDFKNGPARAFMHGFMKGLASPVVLYHVESAPAIPKISYVYPSNTTIAEAIAGDWQRIGTDLYNVISSNDPTQIKQQQAIGQKKYSAKSS